jgi:SAM-dependent methyltransferase
MIPTTITDEPLKDASILRWREPVICCDTVWEENYARFETPEEEIQKFITRFRELGASEWSPDARILDIFCGRGNGLKALERLGFNRLEGVDLSARLLEQYSGPAQLYVGDAGELKLGDACIDIVVVQGGLHHLPNVEEDLGRILSEIQRVLKNDGRFVLVEPWNTTFLKVVHLLCRQPILCRAWGKLGALAVMIERERETYFNWLEQPRFVLSTISRFFVPELRQTSWGKLKFVGRKLNNR